MSKLIEKFKTELEMALTTEVYLCEKLTSIALIYEQTINSLEFASRNRYLEEDIEELVDDIKKQLKLIRDEYYQKALNVG